MKPSSFRSALPWCALAAFYLVVTFWMTRPVLWHAGSAVVGSPGDNLYFAWLVSWYRDAIVHWRSPLHVPMLNAPEGWNLAYNEINATMVLGVPGFLFGGAAAAYNLRFWLTFVLSALLTAVWVWRLTGRIAPSMIAGLMFGFAPYRLSHAWGHLNLLATEALPLYFLCFTELLRTGGIGWAIGAAFATAMLAGSSQYYLYMTAVISIPIAVPLLRARPGWYRDPRLARSLVLFATVAATAVFILVWPYLSLARQGLIQTHVLSDVSMWSASPTDLLMPPPVHWLWGHWVDMHFDRHLWLESTINVGMTTLVLAFIGWRSRSEHAPLGLLARTCWLAAAIALVLALGTELHWLGRIVDVPVPDQLQPYVGAPRAIVRLPGYVLFNYLPFYNTMRVWMRWGIYAMLFLSVLAGIGFERLTRGRSRRAVVALAAVVCALVIVEFTQAPYPLTPVEGRPVDRWLAERRDGGLVIQLPSDELGQPPYMFYASVSRHPYVGAAFSPFQTPQYLRIDPALRTFPSEKSVETMRSIAVRWVVVDKARYPDPDRMREEAIRFGLDPQVDLDGQLVFRLR